MMFCKRLAVAAGVLVLSTQTALAELRVGVAAEPYPPFASKDASGQWVGWEVDFMSELCSELKEQCTLTETAWDGIIPALQGKKIDVILASMAITEKRKAEIAFSTFYYNSSVSIVATNGGANAISAEALSGKTIGVQTATISAAYAEKHFGSSTVKAYATLDDATADLAAGRVDAVQGETNALAAFLATEAGKACCISLGVVPPDPATLGEGVGAGLRKEDAELKTRIDTAIAAMAKTGAFKRLAMKYPELDGKIIVPE